MSKKMNRRSFIRSAGAATAVAGTIAMPSVVLGAAHGKKNVVVIGGGTGGATAAKYLKRADPSINVTLIEPNKTYYTCYLSNVYVIGGGKGIDSIGHGFGGLAKHGVKVVHDYVTGIDAKAKKITTKGGASIAYDRCIVSPGIDFKWESTPGYDEAASGTIAHAWNAGAQTAMLRKQLEEMKDGGTFLMAPPPNPFKCPPGPYERAAQVAGYFKKHKPKSKVLILDPKGKFSKFGLFKQAWGKFYGFKEGSDDGMIVWRGTPKGSDDNKIVKVDVAGKSIETGFGTEKGDVLNIIPAQKAGKIAFAAGLTKGDWCPVNLRTFESPPSTKTFMSLVIVRLPKVCQNQVMLPTLKQKLRLLPLPLLSLAKMLQSQLMSIPATQSQDLAMASPLLLFTASRKMDQKSRKSLAV